MYPTSPLVSFTEIMLQLNHELDVVVTMSTSARSRSLCEFHYQRAHVARDAITKNPLIAAVSCQSVRTRVNPHQWDCSADMPPDSTRIRICDEMSLFQFLPRRGNFLQQCCVFSIESVVNINGTKDSVDEANSIRSGIKTEKALREEQNKK